MSTQLASAPPSTQLAASSADLSPGWTRTPICKFPVPVGLPLFDLHDVPGNAAFTSEDLIARLRPRPEGRQALSAERDELAARFVRHLGITKVSRPGTFCFCALVSRRHGCEFSIRLGDTILPCRSAYRQLGLDHVRLAVARGRKILIAANYDGFFKPYEPIADLLWAFGLEMQATEWSPYLPTRTLSLIVRPRERHTSAAVAALMPDRRALVFDGIRVLSRFRDADIYTPV